MMLAALMVLGTSAMAQSETLKGDVNADGVVDVADIAAVIKIMADNADNNGETKYYWYVGQENPAEIDDITKLEGIQQVTEYPSTYEYTAPTRNYVYILVKNNKTIPSIINPLSNNAINYSEVTSTIDGYRIYKTAGIAANGKILITIGVAEQTKYYWYVGQENPANLDESFDPGDNLATDYVSGGGWYLLGDAVPETIQQLVKGGDSSKYWYVAMPITTPTTLKPVATDMTTLDTTAQAQTTKPFAGVNYQIYWYSGGAGARNTFRFAKK